MTVTALGYFTPASDSAFEFAAFAAVPMNIANPSSLKTTIDLDRWQEKIDKKNRKNKKSKKESQGCRAKWHTGTLHSMGCADGASSQVLVAR